MNILLPLQISEGRFASAESPKEAVDSFIDMLLSTAVAETGIDRDFGFILNNFRFEIIRNVTGNSQSTNTMAAELKSALERYERRLSNITVAMTYVRNSRKVRVSVEGTIMETSEPYKYVTDINLWN